MPLTADSSQDLASVLGIPDRAPPSPTAAPTVNTAPPVSAFAPTVSTTPKPGQGVALTSAGVLPVAAAATGIRMLAADPASPLIGEFWYRTDSNQFCVKTSTGVKRVSLA